MKRTGSVKRRQNIDSATTSC